MCARRPQQHTQQQRKSAANEFKASWKIWEKNHHHQVLFEYMLFLFSRWDIFRVLLFIVGLSLLFAWRKEWALPSRSAAEIQVRFLTNTRWTRRIGSELMIVSVLSQFSLFSCLPRLKTHWLASCVISPCIYVYLSLFFILQLRCKSPSKTRFFLISLSVQILCTRLISSHICVLGFAHFRHISCM